MSHTIKNINPKVEYAELITVSLDVFGTFEIWMIDDQTEVSFVDSAHNRAVRFIDIEHADLHCSHESPDRIWRRAYNEGSADLAHKAALVAKNWHNEVHDGSYRFCREEPCFGLAGIEIS